MKAIRQVLVRATDSAECARLRLLLTAVGLVACWISAALLGGDALAATTPSQAPLYSAVPGAKPNVMFVLDNSGSMAFEFQDTYSITSSSGDNWYAMRSSNVNTQYYNPAITYLPRINKDGTPQINNLKFVDNQASESFFYTALGGNYSASSNGRVPDYIEYNVGDTVPNIRKFTYVRCVGASCPAATRTVVDLNSPIGSGTVALPTGHQRTDCGTNATTCTAALELQNVLNWYKWYRTRMLAVSTAVGQAMSSYDNKFRVGYVQYNSTANNNLNTANNIVRGVRYFTDDPSNASNNWKTQFYNWLYGVVPAGGTPSHNALSLAGNYYGSATSTYGNPWKNDPTNTGSVSNTSDLSCRRSYSIVLSDGAWNESTSQNASTKYASTQGTNFSGTPSGNSAALQYKPAGATGYDNANLAIRRTARELYIPYGDGGNSSNGFADLTARYFWHTDFSGLPNNVPPIAGQNNPTFWQNMTTFTIGWGLTPSGETGTANGLTWAQINQYNRDWLLASTTSTPTLPKWPTGNLNNGNDDAANARRVDDFIRAGFTGGGRSFSVYSGEDVRKALDNALSGMVGAGNDAGVAVSGNSSEFQTLENQYKYTTEYKTVDNTGDVKAFRLNATGGYLSLDPSGKAIPAWSANDRMPALASRKIFALSNYDANAPASTTAQRIVMKDNTPLSGLPVDFRALLNADNLQKTDASFIRYMLGEDPQVDVNGTLYRSRKQPIGASVNSPPVFVGGRVNMGYGTSGLVDGKDSYGAYKSRKDTLPATIFAATNNGKVHVLNAAKDDNTLPGIPAGTELAEFMLKGTMASQIDLAKANYRFRYTLDGPLVEEDIYDKNGATPAGGPAAWRQLLIGSGGRAGSFMYGLESPQNTSNRTPTENHFLWELSDKTTGYANLATVTNNTTAGQLDDGTWVVLTGSGHYGGASGKQVGLYVIEALTGKRWAFIQLPPGFGADDTVNGGNRGLGGVVAVRDSNRRIVAAYAGDANGNLWRFDLRKDRFVVSYGKPLFTTSGGKKQPIYATPAWQAHPGDGSTCRYSATTQCGAIVMVGTGILLDEDDLATPATKQAIYGIWDPTSIGGDDKSGFNKVLVSDLVTQTIDIATAKLGTGLEVGKNFYKVSANEVDWQVKKGWLLNLGVISYSGAMLNGERVVGDLSNLGSSVVIASFLPEDKNLGIESCTATGNLPNNIYVLDALTGKNQNSFDIDSNGSFDPYSVVSVPAGGFTRGSVDIVNGVIGKNNEDYVGPESGNPGDCKEAVGRRIGLNDPQYMGRKCSASTTGWRRSWRSLITPAQ